MTTMIYVYFLTLAMAATVTLALDSRDVSDFLDSYPIIKSRIWFQTCKVDKGYKLFDETRSKDGQFVVYRINRISYDLNNGLAEEYVLPLEEYLSALIPRQQEKIRNGCLDCGYTCHFRPQSDECSYCSETCSYIKKMKSNGYVDATDFSTCKLIDKSGHLYAGPMCSNSGSEIRIGVFEDPQCTVPDPTKQVDDYLKDDDGKRLKLSYKLFELVYQNHHPAYLVNTEYNGIYCDDPILCGSLFNNKFRCETRYGDLLSPMTEEEKREQECVCSFIKTLKNGEIPETTKDKKAANGLVDMGFTIESHSYAAALNHLPTQSIKIEHRGDKNGVGVLPKLSIFFKSCRATQDFDKSKSKDGQFVIFRVCRTSQNADPTFWCGCRDDNPDFVMPLEDYLAAVVPHQIETEAKFCYECQWCINTPLEGIFTDFCKSCSNICSHFDQMEDGIYTGDDVIPSYLQEMENIGYVDAIKFSHCQMINDDLFAGPVCSGDNGSAISVGVFKDSECTIPDLNKQVDDYLENGLKMTYDMLERIYGNHNGNFHIFDSERSHRGISCMSNLFEANDACLSLASKSERYETRVPATEEEAVKEEE